MSRSSRKKDGFWGVVADEKWWKERGGGVVDEKWWKGGGVDMKWWKVGGGREVVS